jgi:hypothetical protein
MTETAQLDDVACAPLAGRRALVTGGSTLEGRVALVTGGSKGIGRAISRSLAEAGASVVVNYAGDAEAAKRTVAEIENSGGRAMTAHADKAHADEVRRMFADVNDAFGVVDIVVDNAAVYSFQPFEDITEAEFHRQFDTTDLLGAQFLTEPKRGTLTRMTRREHQQEVNRLLHAIADLAGRIEGRRAHGARATGLVGEQRSLEKIRAELREFLFSESLLPARSDSLEDVIDHTMPVLSTTPQRRRRPELRLDHR